MPLDKEVPLCLREIPFENDLLNLVLAAKPIANLADNASSSPIANICMALHTADPGETGSQTTSEATYGAYARVNVARSTLGWLITGSSASPISNVTFPACTSGTNTITHASAGTASTGAGKILYSGAVTPNLSISAGVTPRLTTASTITED